MFQTTNQFSTWNIAWRAHQFLDEQTANSASPALRKHRRRSAIGPETGSICGQLLWESMVPITPIWTTGARVVTRMSRKREPRHKWSRKHQMDWWNLLPKLRKVNVILGYFPVLHFASLICGNLSFGSFKQGGTSKSIAIWLCRMNMVCFNLLV